MKELSEELKEMTDHNAEDSLKMLRGLAEIEQNLTTCEDIKVRGLEELVPTQEALGIFPDAS